MNKKALEGIKVLDFGWVLASPLTSKLLADLGATVIRIESSTRVDGLRTNRPYKDNMPGVNRSGYFCFYNANKYSMALNLKHSKGIEIAKRLIKWADIVTENFMPGAMERLGLGYEELIKIKPDIIMLSLSMQGATGPYSPHRGYGIQLTGFTGFTHLTGWPDRPPSQPYGGVTDFIVPAFAATGLISALIHREKTGKGQYLDLSQTEASIQFIAPLMLDYFLNGRVANRNGNYCSYACPHGVYPCKGEEQYCAIAVFSDSEWESFCSILGNDAWVNDPRFATLRARKENEQELDALIGAWTINFTAETVMELMQRARVAAGIVQKPEDLLEDPGLKARNLFWFISHKELGSFPHLGQPFQLSETPVQPRMAAPCLGEHTEYICTNILGMSDEEFLGLLTQGAFE